MNRRKKHFRIMAVALCLALVVGFGASYQARAESTPDFPVVSNAQEFLEAFDKVEDGGAIGISNMISFYGGERIGSEDKRITVIRLNENARFSFTLGDSAFVYNIIFDGNNIKSLYPMVYSEQEIAIQKCLFQNCVSNNAGAAVRIIDAKGTFTDCIFTDNSGYNGGHVSIKKGEFYNCTFTNGSAVSEGGAVFCAGSVNFYNCTITKNYSSASGGGIFNANGTCIFEGTKLFNNSAVYCGDDYASTNGFVYFAESVAESAVLYEDEGLKPIEWEIGDYFGGVAAKLILEKISDEPTEPEEPETPDDPENPDEPENPDDPTEPEPENPENPENPDNPEQPENPENPDEPTNPEQPEQQEEPDTPEQPDEPESPGDGTEEPDTPETPDNSEEQPTETPSDGEQGETPDQGQGGGSENPPSTDGGDTSTNTDNSSTPTDNSTTNTTTSSSTNTSTSSTDSSDRSTTTDNSRNETDNSRQITTTDSNNTSTVNYYYTVDGQSTGNPNGVQTIVIPAGTSGSGEPINQTIRVESSQPEGGISGGGGDITLNVNVNIGEQTAQQPQMQAQPMIQQGAASPDSASGFSLYQVLVLCLLSAVLVCLIKRR